MICPSNESRSDELQGFIKPLFYSKSKMISLFSTRFIKPPTADCGIQNYCFFQRQNHIGIYQATHFGTASFLILLLHLRRQTLRRCISINIFLLLRGQLSARMMTDVATMLLGKHRQRGLSFITPSMSMEMHRRGHIWENYYTFQSIEFQCNFTTI